MRAVATTLRDREVSIVTLADKHKVITHKFILEHALKTAARRALEHLHRAVAGDDDLPFVVAV